MILCQTIWETFAFLKQLLENSNCFCICFISILKSLPDLVPSYCAFFAKQRQKCDDCDRIAPSQQSLPPAPYQYPDYPFQQVCSDFFHHKGHYGTILVCVDRYSNWPIVEKAFVTYGILDEFSSDGGPEFSATSTTTFLHNWGVSHQSVT